MALRRGLYRWVMGAGALVAVVVVAAALDYTSLKRHAAAGPHVFTATRCAGTQKGGSGAAAGNPGVGLSSWTTFQAGPTHNLLLPGVATAGAPLAVSWRFRTGGSIVTAPAVVEGTAYAGSMDGCIYALDVTTGRLLWSFAAGNQVMSEPLVEGGRVFFGSGNKGMGETSTGIIVRGTGTSGLYALDAATGKQLWFVPTLGESMPTPAYRDGVLYEVGGGKEFYAVDAASGTVLWSLPVGAYVSMSSPTLDGDIAVFGTAHPYTLMGVDLITHRIAWSLPLPTAGSGVDDVSPAVTAGTAYIQVPEGMLTKRIVEMAVGTQDGTVHWERTLGDDRLNVLQRALGGGDLGAHDGEETGGATVVGDRLYVGSPGLRGLWALDARTGAPVWHATLSNAIRAAPVIAGDVAYTTSDTRLFKLDAATGRVLRSAPVNTFDERSGILIPCTTPGPVVVGATLLVGGGSDTDTLIALPLEGAA